MAAQNSGVFNTPQDAASERRENSYEKPLPSAPDIQQPGKAGDVGNGPATGHTKPPVPNAPSSSEKKESAVREKTVKTPDEGAEPSNPYSGV
jgi:hypothetical protein